ncbi:putative phage abortive infection protein [Pseudomonas thivervalensis]|uniref:putative phage abortive infection protein n=1 Tax=Pseudomonas thivervalensis TaxID=86265 RepID=UPI003D993030
MKLMWSNGVYRSNRTRLAVLLSYISENRFFIVVSVFAFSVCTIIFGSMAYHFFFGLDLPVIKVLNTDSASYWGQLGDFAGGFLNPLLSFLALMAVLKTMALQRIEMRAAQREAKIATQEQRQQTAVYSRQMFESTLFGLLDAHAKILNDINAGGCSGRSAIEFIVNKCTSSPQYTNAIFYPDMCNSKDVREYLEGFWFDWKGSVGHYFRNLYWIMKTIDSSRDGFDLEDRIKSGGKVGQRFYVDYLRKRNYTSLVRAQLSEFEMALLQLNCLTEDGADLKYYVEKYSLLKPLGENYFSAWKGTFVEEFSPSTFQGVEDVDIDHLIKMEKDKTRRGFTAVRRAFK